MSKSVVRNAQYKRGGLSVRERHNERKNEGYQNEDIIRERAAYNVHFKQAEGGYEQMFDAMLDQNVTCALAKMFPNVFIDVCWAHMISPSACVSALDDFLDAVPYNKISTFGGDYCFVDGVYGHLQISRQNVAYTLTGKVARGVFDERKVLDIARALYYDNPKRIFRL